MPSAATAKRYGHVAARLLAILGGILLGTVATASYFIAGYRRARGGAPRQA